VPGVATPTTDFILVRGKYIILRPHTHEIVYIIVRFALRVLRQLDRERLSEPCALLGLVTRRSENG